MGYKKWSDSYLMKLNKKELIEHIRMLEHNWNQSKITVERQLELLKKYCESEKEE